MSFSDFIPETIKKSVNYYFPTKSPIDPDALQREKIDDKIKKFNQAWNELKKTDQILLPVGSVSLCLALMSMPALIIFGVADVMLYRYLQRSEKAKEFQTRLEDLYKCYKERIEPSFILNQETIKILDTLAPFVKDSNVLIPKDFGDVMSKEGGEKKSEAGRTLFEQWCDIMLRAPHFRRFDFVDTKNSKTSSYGIFKKPTLTERIDNEVIQKAYALDFGLKKEM
ncbi:MAG: hypothetical protein ACYCQI_09500 [Gammaproteobacteria bacterium]